MTTEVQVADHGYVKLIETWGSDERVIEAARMSTQKGFLGWPQDEKLLRYLYENAHHTPFEMAGAVFEVRLPIFVAREWMRHRTQSFNEMSARYIEPPELFYVPEVSRLCEAPGHSKQTQGRNKEPIHPVEAMDARKLIQKQYEGAWDTYEKLLRMGVTRELARIVLPVGMYTVMRSSCNLRNWLHFCHLRQAEGAQSEIRWYADAIVSMLEESFPRTLKLYAEQETK